MTSNKCITCGIPIPEGRQVCKACEDHGKEAVSECEYCVDGICVNADAPIRADYCPVPYEPYICRYEKRKE